MRKELMRIYTYSVGMLKYYLGRSPEEIITEDTGKEIKTYIKNR